MSDAWLGYKDGRLVAIELAGFNRDETIADWESRGYTVVQTTDAEAIATWRRDVLEKDIRA
jgi:hypothetical protein